MTHIFNLFNCNQQLKKIKKIAWGKIRTHNLQFYMKKFVYIPKYKFHLLVPLVNNKMRDEKDVIFMDLEIIVNLVCLCRKIFNCNWSNHRMWRHLSTNPFIIWLRPYLRKLVDCARRKLLRRRRLRTFSILLLMSMLLLLMILIWWCWCCWLWWSCCDW